jgi:hypothetical protein
VSGLTIVASWKTDLPSRWANFTSRWRSCGVIVASNDLVLDLETLDHSSLFVLSGIGNAKAFYVKSQEVSAHEEGSVRGGPQSNVPPQASF